MDESLELVAISPLRTHGLHASKKISVTREKLERSFDKQVTIVAAAINVEKGLLEDDLMDKANNYDQLLYLMKGKLWNYWVLDIIDYHKFSAR